MIALVARSVILTALVMSAALVPSGCTADKPKVRVENRRAEVVDVQLKRQEGSTHNFHDVGGGYITGYVDVDKATYEVDAKIEGISASATTFFTARDNAVYTVVVLNANPPGVRVEER